MKTTCLILASLTILLALSPANADASSYRIAILDDGMPSLDKGIVNRVREILRKGGYQASTLSAGDISNRARFNKRRFDCLVLTDSPHFPAPAKDSLNQFTQAGGNLVLLGGHPFHDPMFPVGQSWLSMKDCLRRGIDAPLQHVLFMFDKQSTDLSAWTRASNNPRSPSSIEFAEDYRHPAEGPTNRSLQVNLVQLTGWDNYGVRICGIPASHDLLSFCAAAGSGTRQIAMELREADGARFTTVVDIKPDWKRVQLKPRDFRYYEGGNARSKDSIVSFSNATEIRFGLADNFTSQDLGGDYSFRIDEVGTLDSKGLGVPDVSDFDLAVYSFEDIGQYKLSHISTVKASHSFLTKDMVSTGNCYEGRSAVATALPMRSHFVPVLDADDKYDRTQGWAAGLLVNFAGDCKGSQWLIYGITNRQFYLTDKVFENSLLDTVRRMSSGALVARYAAADLASRSKMLPCTTPAPKGFVHLSKDGTQFLDGEDKPLFLTGANYIGPFDRVGYMGYGPFPPEHDWFRPDIMLKMTGAWDANLLEDDFRKARAAGINMFRYWGHGLEMNPYMVESVGECARKYGIYLLIHVDFRKKSQAEIENWIKVVTNAWKDEPMVLGYDLINEPDIETVGSIDIDGKPTPIRSIDWYERYKGKLGDSWRKRYESTDNYPCLKSLWGTGRNALNCQVFMELYSKLGSRYGDLWNYQTLNSKLDRDDPEYGDLISALDDTFGAWAAMQIKAVRKVDKNHLISIGYNQMLEDLPSNEQIDFLTQHAYPWIQTYKGMMTNVRFVDRIRAAFPNKPIAYGETGYSNGVKTKTGEYMDFQSSCLGDLLHYLYSWAHGYSGHMKWALNDWPEAIMRDNGYWQGPYDLQGRFGIYYYDGTVTGRPKPFVYAMKFFRDYLDTYPTDKGTLDIREGGTPFDGAFTFKAEDALFVGDSSCKADGLEFSSAKPITVMIRRHDGQLRVMATADVDVRINVSQWLNNADSRSVGISGKHISRQNSGNWLKLSLMEGEAVTISPASVK